MVFYYEKNISITVSRLAMSRSSWVVKSSSTEVRRLDTLSFANSLHLLYQVRIRFCGFAVGVVLKYALVLGADFSEPYGSGDNRIKYGKMPFVVLLDSLYHVFSEIGVIRHRQEYSAYL